MMIVIFIFSFLLSPFVFAQVYIPQALNLQERSYELGVEGSLFNSREKVNYDKEKFAFQNGETFSQMRADLYGSFGWTPEVELTGGVRFISNSSSVYNTTTNSLQDVSNSGVESYYLQVNYMPKRKGTWISNVEISYRQPAYTNPEYNSNTPYSHLVLGDATKEIRAGYRFFKGFVKKGQGIEGSLFLNAPLDLSNEINFDLGYIIEKSKWAYWGRINGIFSLSGDEYSDNPTSKPKSYTGSSYLYNSINREKLSGEFGLLYKINKLWRIKASYEHDFMGRSTDLGGRLLIGLSYRVSSLYADKQKISSFKDYNIEAIVEKSSSRGNYVVINKGFTHGVSKGMSFDFFAFDFKGGNKLIAQGQVVKERAKESIVKITKWYQGTTTLSEGVVGRSQLR